MHARAWPRSLRHGQRSTSTVGEALAGLIHRELVARTRMLDCGIQPRTWEMLRLTRMPAVRIESAT